MHDNMGTQVNEYVVNKKKFNVGLCTAFPGIGIQDCWDKHGDKQLYI